MSILRLTYEAAVTFHPYRSAMVYDRFLEMDRNSEEVRAFEDYLAKAAGNHPDNHTAYTLKLNGYGGRENPPELYVMCSDSKISIGSRIEFGSW